MLSQEPDKLPAVIWSLVAVVILIGLLGITIQHGFSSNPPERKATAAEAVQPLQPLQVVSKIPQVGEPSTYTCTFFLGQSRTYQAHMAKLGTVRNRMVFYQIDREANPKSKLGYSDTYRVVGVASHFRSCSETIRPSRQIPLPIPVDDLPEPPAHFQVDGE